MREGVEKGIQETRGKAHESSEMQCDANGWLLESPKLLYTRSELEDKSSAFNCCAKT